MDSHSFWHRAHRLLGALALALAAIAVAAAGPAVAQNPFEPAIKVNNRVITNFQLQQRTLFLTLLNAGPDPANLARDQLINEALQFAAAELDSVTVSADAVIAAQTQFAAQGQFERDAFIQALGENGVEAATFRDFITSGLVWRETVRQRFGPRAQVTEDDIDRALAQVPSPGGTRVLMTEILMPATDPQSEAASRARAEQLRQLTDEDAFSNAARRFSAAPSRLQGGQIDWRPLDSLPEEIQIEVARLSPGQITPPIRLPEAIALFQLRAREEVAQGSVEIVSAEYAEFLIPGGRSGAALAEAERLRQRVRSCDDLFGQAGARSEGRLSRQTTRLNALPADVAREIAALDDNEVSTNLVRGDNLVFLMLCRRTVRESAAVDRAQARQFLVNQRLETFANGYLNELRLASDIEILR